MKNIKFNLNVSVYFFYIILIACVFFIYFLDRGLDTTDESYSLLYSLYNKDVIGKITNFGLIGNIILEIVNFDLYHYRIVGFFLLTVCCFISFKCLFIFYKSENFDIFSDKYLFLFIVIAGSLSFYRFWVVTPSYNLFNFCGALIFLSGLLIFLGNSTILKNYKAILLISSGLLICFISKPSTSIFLSITLLFWCFFMHKKSFLKFIAFLSLFGILIFLSYVFLNFESLDFFLNDFFLGYELKKSLDPRYSFFQLFIFTIKYITKDIINHWFLLLPQLFFMLVFRKKIKALMLIFPILSVVLFHNLSVLVVSLLINLFIFCKVNLIFQKKNSVMVLFPIIIFCITLGTNTNPVRHMQTSAMLYFLLIFHILCLYPIDKKLKVAFIILFLSIHVSSNIKNNLYKPQRHLNNIFKQNIKIQIPQFNSDIYVDTFLKSYFDQTTSLKSKINNKKIKYLIDYTGRQPVLNLFFDLKFISQPWWTSGYSGSDNYVNKIQEISNTKKILNASLVVTYQSDNLQTLDINNLKKIGINLLDDYEILGIIDLQKYTKNNNWNFVVWKPKK